MSLPWSRSYFLTLTMCLYGTLTGYGGGEKAVLKYHAGTDGGASLVRSAGSRRSS